MRCRLEVAFEVSDTDKKLKLQKPNTVLFTSSQQQHVMGESNDLGIPKKYTAVDCQLVINNRFSLKDGIQYMNNNLRPAATKSAFSRYEVLHFYLH
jgi:hypothetical protein